MAQAWYTFPRIDNFGQIDPQGNYYKPDSNILTPPGYPVTAVLAGKVTSVQRTGYGQTVITIQLNQAINSLAKYMFFEHMHDATVNVNNTVVPGTLIGHANYLGEGAALGVGFYSGPVYGSGAAWNVLQADLAPGGAGLLNPVNLLNSLRNGTIFIPQTTTLSSTNNLTNTLSLTANQVHATLNNVPGFQGIVEALDQVEMFQPFQIQGSGGQALGIIGDLPIIGDQLKNAADVVSLPQDTMQALLVFTVANTAAFMIRALIVLIGGIIVVSLVQNALNQQEGISPSDILDIAGAL